MSLSFLRSQMIQGAIHHSTPLVEQSTSDDHLELETQIGMVDEKGYTSGVSRDFFITCLQKMISCNTWNSTEEWTDTIDFFYKEGIRHTVTRGDDPNVTVVKKKVGDVTFVCPERSEEKKNFGIRVSLKSEVPYTDAFPRYQHHYVRVKRRKSFNYKNNILYCFTIVAHGKTKEDAIYNNETNTTYEIELELLNRKSMRPDDIASSLLEKNIDFFGRNDPYTLHKL